MTEKNVKRNVIEARV